MAHKQRNRETWPSLSSNAILYKVVIPPHEVQEEDFEDVSTRQTNPNDTKELIRGEPSSLTLVNLKECGQALGNTQTLSRATSLEIGLMLVTERCKLGGVNSAEEAPTISGAVARLISLQGRRIRFTSSGIQRMPQMRRTRAHRGRWSKIRTTHLRRLQYNTIDLGVPFGVANSSGTKA